MATDREIVDTAATVLGGVAATIPGPVGIALSILSEVVGPIYTAILGGGDPNETVNAIRASLVALSDAQMKKELGE